MLHFAPVLHRKRTLWLLVLLEQGGLHEPTQRTVLVWKEMLQLFLLFRQWGMGYILLVGGVDTVTSSTDTSYTLYCVWKKEWPSLLKVKLSIRSMVLLNYLSE